MKHIWMVIRLALPVAAIILLVLWMIRGGNDAKLLGAGLLCSSLGACLNLCFQRKARKEGGEHE